MKLKFTFKSSLLESLEIDVPGDSGDITAQFEAMLENGLEKLLRQASNVIGPIGGMGDAQISYYKHNPPSTTLTIPKETPDNLNTIVLKSGSRPEVEWVLIYAYYSSNFGRESFTRDDIVFKYEDTDRDEENRKRNLSNNLKSLARSNLIIVLETQAEFKITHEGIKKAVRLINKISTGKSAK